MKPISLSRHTFAADLIRQAVWLYFRFSLSSRDVEEIMARTTQHSNAPCSF